MASWIREPSIKPDKSHHFTTTDWDGYVAVGPNLDGSSVKLTVSGDLEGTKVKAPELEGTNATLNGALSAASSAVGTSTLQVQQGTAGVTLVGTGTKVKFADNTEQDTAAIVKNVSTGLNLDSNGVLTNTATAYDGTGVATISGVNSQSFGGTGAITAANDAYGNNNTITKLNFPRGTLMSSTLAVRDIQYNWESTDWTLNNGTAWPGVDNQVRISNLKAVHGVRFADDTVQTTAAYGIVQSVGAGLGISSTGELTNNNPTAYDGTGVNPISAATISTSKLITNGNTSRGSGSVTTNIAFTNSVFPEDETSSGNYVYVKNLRVEGSSAAGITFADGTTQSTAASGGGGGNGYLGISSPAKYSPDGATARWYMIHGTPMSLGQTIWTAGQRQYTPSYSNQAHTGTYNSYRIGRDGGSFQPPNMKTIKQINSEISGNASDGSDLEICFGIDSTHGYSGSSYGDDYGPKWYYIYYRGFRLLHDINGNENGEHFVGLGTPASSTQWKIKSGYEPDSLSGWDDFTWASSSSSPFTNGPFGGSASLAASGLPILGFGGSTQLTNTQFPFGPYMTSNNWVYWNTNNNSNPSVWDYTSSSPGTRHSGNSISVVMYVKIPDSVNVMSTAASNTRWGG